MSWIKEKSQIKVLTAKFNQVNDSRTYIRNTLKDILVELQKIRYLNISPVQKEKKKRKKNQ